MNKKLSILTIICCCFLFLYTQVDAKGGKESGKGKNKPVWTATKWQKTLPPVSVEEKGKQKEYKFLALIKADGYLCPGSARAYKTLQVALPMLFENITPIKGDFKITYGPSDCTTKVYKYFMKNFTSKKYLELDKSIVGRTIIISRISTGRKVIITYDSSSGSQGHDPEGAKAGDVILHAEDGNGMSIINQGT